MCRDWHLADDLTQNASTKLFLAWPRVSKAEDVDAYARKFLLRSFSTTTAGVRRPRS